MEITVKMTVEEFENYLDYQKAKNPTMQDLKFIEKIGELLENSNRGVPHPQTGLEVVKLGSLYVDGSLQPVPARPWYGEIAGERGDIPRYSGGKIEFRDDVHELRWVKVTLDGKILYICDRVILCNVSWDILNEQGLIFGRELTLSNGARVKIRSLTGGHNWRVDGDCLSGGRPLDNEWDKIICNEANIPGLPSPESPEHNALWSWKDIWTICQETDEEFFAHRALRGGNSARRWDRGAATNTTVALGWRPCLEVLESAPL